MGHVQIPSDGKPARAVILQPQPTKLPAGFVFEDEAAAILGVTMQTLRHIVMTDAGRAM